MSIAALYIITDGQSGRAIVMHGNMRNRYREFCFI